MYGNLISIEKKDSIGFTIAPRYFIEHFTEATEPHTYEEVLRELDNNQLILSWKIFRVKMESPLSF
jgi:hypothetical protein